MDGTTEGNDARPLHHQNRAAPWEARAPNNSANPPSRTREVMRSVWGRGTPGTRMLPGRARAQHGSPQPRGGHGTG
eukprot:8365692-Lingulodinium_polyedra.AAC.1